MTLPNMYHGEKLLKENNKMLMLGLGDRITTVVFFFPLLSIF